MHTLFGVQPIPLFLGPIGPMEWVILIALALLIFGGRRLGDIGKGLGEGIKNFRSAISGPPASSPDDKSAGSGKSS